MAKSKVKPDAGMFANTGKRRKRSKYPTSPVSFALTDSEIEGLEAIAAKMTSELDTKITRSKIGRFAVQYFLAQYESGAVNPSDHAKEEKVTVTKLGDYG